MNSLLLTEEYLVKILQNKQVQSEFPHVAELNQSLGKVAGCGSCRNQPTHNSPTSKLKSFIINMPPTETEKLKRLLGIPLNVTLRTYVRDGNKVLRKVEI